MREAQAVQAYLYNLLGQQVATLHDGPLQPETPLTLTVAGDRLASGVYFVRVVGEQFSATRRLTVVR